MIKYGIDNSEVKESSLKEEDLKKKEKVESPSSQKTAEPKKNKVEEVN